MNQFFKADQEECMQKFGVSSKKFKEIVAADKPKDEDFCSVGCLALKTGIVSRCVNRTHFRTRQYFETNVVHSA